MAFTNKIYLISYFHGTSGQFIRAITHLFLAKYDKLLFFPSDGTAENLSLPIYEGNECSYNLTYSYNQLEDNFFNCITPLNNKLFLYAEHPPPDWETLFDNFPNGKNIIIQLNESMLYRQTVNSYYKQKFNGIKDVSSIDQVLAKKTVDSNFQKFGRTQIKNNVITYPYRDTDIIPEKYKDKIFLINLYDIIHNKTKVLETLSTATNKPITKKIEASYALYLERQRKLFPWLDDK